MAILVLVFMLRIGHLIVLILTPSVRRLIILVGKLHICITTSKLTIAVVAVDPEISIILPLNIFCAGRLMRWHYKSCRYILLRGLHSLLHDRFVFFRIFSQHHSSIHISR